MLTGTKVEVTTGSTKTRDLSRRIGVIVGYAWRDLTSTMGVLEYVIETEDGETVRSAASRVKAA